MTLSDILARQQAERGSELNLGVISFFWNERDHPRDILGRFKDKINDASVGDQVITPNKVKITKLNNGITRGPDADTIKIEYGNLTDYRRFTDELEEQDAVEDLAKTAIAWETSLEQRPWTIQAKSILAERYPEIVGGQADPDAADDPYSPESRAEAGQAWQPGYWGKGFLVLGTNDQGVYIPTAVTWPVNKNGNPHHTEMYWNFRNDWNVMTGGRGQLEPIDYYNTIWIAPDGAFTQAAWINSNGVPSVQNAQQHMLDYDDNNGANVWPASPVELYKDPQVNRLMRADWFKYLRWVDPDRWVVTYWSDQKNRGFGHARNLDQGLSEEEALLLDQTLVEEITHEERFLLAQELSTSIEVPDLALNLDQELEQEIEAGLTHEEKLDLSRVPRFRPYLHPRDIFGRFREVFRSDEDGFFDPIDGGRPETKGGAPNQPRYPYFNKVEGAKTPTYEINMDKINMEVDGEPYDPGPDRHEYFSRLPVIYDINRNEVFIGTEGTDHQSLIDTMIRDGIEADPKTQIQFEAWKNELKTNTFQLEDLGIDPSVIENIVKESMDAFYANPPDQVRRRKREPLKDPDDLFDQIHGTEADRGRVFDYRQPFLMTPDGELVMGYPGQHHEDLDRETVAERLGLTPGQTEGDAYWEAIMPYEGHVLDHPEHGKAVQWPQVILNEDPEDRPKESDVLDQAQAVKEEAEWINSGGTLEETESEPEPKQPLGHARTIAEILERKDREQKISYQREDTINTRSYVAMNEDGERIGEIDWRLRPTFGKEIPKEDRWEVTGIEVDERYRRQGIGMNLLDHAMEDMGIPIEDVNWKLMPDGRKLVEAYKARRDENKSVDNPPETDPNEDGISDASSPYEEANAILESMGDDEDGNPIEPWGAGHWGKGFVDDKGRPVIWKVRNDVEEDEFGSGEDNGAPHHTSVYDDYPTAYYTDPIIVSPDGTYANANYDKFTRHYDGSSAEIPDIKIEPEDHPGLTKRMTDTEAFVRQFRYRGTVIDLQSEDDPIWERDIESDSPPVIESLETPDDNLHPVPDAPLPTYRYGKDSEGRIPFIAAADGRVFVGESGHEHQDMYNVLRDEYGIELLNTGEFQGAVTEENSHGDGWFVDVWVPVDQERTVDPQHIDRIRESVRAAMNQGNDPVEPDEPGPDSDLERAQDAGAIIETVEGTTLPTFKVDTAGTGVFRDETPILYRNDAVWIGNKGHTHGDLYHELDIEPGDHDIQAMGDGSFVKFNDYDEIPEELKDDIRKSWTTATGDTWYWEQREKEGVDTSYRMQHQAPGADEAPAWDLEQAAPDIYGPNGFQYYRTGAVVEDRESWAAIEKMQNDPDAMVTIYRASPEGEINPGDWVTLSRTYAENHAMHFEDPGQDQPVWKADVPARTLNWDGNSINEFGYNGVRIEEPSPIAEMISVLDNGQMPALPGEDERLPIEYYVNEDKFFIGGTMHFELNHLVEQKVGHKPDGPVIQAQINGMFGDEETWYSIAANDYKLEALGINRDRFYDMLDDAVRQAYPGIELDVDDTQALMNQPAPNPKPGTFRQVANRDGFTLFTYIEELSREEQEEIWEQAQRNFPADAETITRRPVIVALSDVEESTAPVEIVVGQSGQWHSQLLDELQWDTHLPQATYLSDGQVLWNDYALENYGVNERVKKQIEKIIRLAPTDLTDI